MMKALVFAAGLGQRMRPITNTLPKPLVTVAGKTLLDHALDRVDQAGFETAIVNVHYLADQIERHVAHRQKPHIIISDETQQLLETGGGTKKALPFFEDKPFLTLNSDTFWIEGASSNIQRMKNAWNSQTMDGLLLLAPTTSSVGYDSKGDFIMDANGLLKRRPEREVAPFVYSGVGILKPQLFDNIPDQAFSLNLVYDRVIAQKRLYGLRLDGIWLHVGTPDAIQKANTCYQMSTL